MLHAYIAHGGGLAPLPESEPLEAAAWIDLYRPLDAQVRRLEELGVPIPTLADMEEIEISNRLYREGDAVTMTAVLPGQLPDGKAVAMPVRCFRLARRWRNGRRVVMVRLSGRWKRMGG